MSDYVTLDLDTFADWVPDDVGTLVVDENAIIDWSHMGATNYTFHAEVNTTSANAGVSLTIYRNIDIAPWTVETGEYVIVTDVTLSTSAAGEVVLFNDTDNSPSDVGAGETIVRISLPANGYLNIRFAIPYWCQPGTGLVILGPAGATVDCQAHGYLRGTPYYVKP